MNDYLQRLMSGYYNFSKPESFNGVKKPHYTDNINKVEQLKKMSKGYYNITPPKTFDGKRLPHYTNELTLDNKFSSYYNLTPPKNFRGEVMPHHTRAILKDATQNLPENFLSPEQRIRYYLSQDLENLGKRVGPVQKQPTLLDLVRNLF
tara:strand:+ start:40 stop:486 length:447 start_codon:yes stop_codon:yes gene_type:complete